MSSIIYTNEDGEETRLEAARIMLITFSPVFNTYNITYRLRFPTSHLLPFPESVVRHQKLLFDRVIEAFEKNIEIGVTTYSDHVLNAARIYAMRRNNGDGMIIHYGEMIEGKEIFTPVWFYPNGTLTSYPSGMCDQWDHELSEMLDTMWLKPKQN